MKSRAQAFSSELLLGYVVFTLVFILIVYLWGNVVKDIFEGEDLFDLENSAVKVSENLLKTPGTPEEWNIDDVIVPGLVNRTRDLREDKVYSFVELMSDDSYDDYCGAVYSNYECNKHLTGVGLYEFEFTMDYLNGSRVYINGTEVASGKTPVNDKRKITMARTAVLNDSIVKVNFIVWRGA